MNDGTLLLRQVHPTFVQQGRITSQVFKPSTKDNNELSVYDGDQISADAAWRHYTENLHLASAGVVAVAVAECVENGLQARLDPRRFPEHAVISFVGIATSQFEKVAKRLKLAAERRGWQNR
jgi:hypothetical protein